MGLRGFLMVLLTAACVLPVSIAIVVGVGRLLAAMQDLSGAVALDRIALALGILWAIDLICVVILLGIHSMGSSDPPDSKH